MKRSLLVASVLPAAILLAADNQMIMPQYAEGKQLIRPEGYREWMFVGANLGIGYDEGASSRPPTFKNIYIQPRAYREFVATGKFPDKTMLVMEVFTSGENDPIVRRGRFQDRFLGVEVALKDAENFAEKWAYFNFIGGEGKQHTQAKAFPKQACWDCHNKHGAADNVFVQFYPALRDARKQAVAAAK